MDREEFLTNMINVLQRDGSLDFNMNLKDLEEWDSLAMMATVAFLDSNFGITLTFNELNKLNTIEDIAKIAGL